MITVRRNIDIARLTTFGIHARCGALVTYTDPRDLPVIYGDPSLPRPFKHIGAGSNLLFTADFPGTIIHSDYRIASLLQLVDSYHIRATAGSIMDQLCELTAIRGLWGLENLSGIPGEVGAAAVQNVGAYGVEAVDLIHSVEAFDTSTFQSVRFTPHQLGYGYRDSAFKHEPMRGRYVITHVTFRLTATPNPRLGYANLREVVARLTPSGEEITPAIVRRAIISLRDGKLPDPATTGSAGSFFKNPVVTAGQFARVCEIEATADVPHYDLPDGRVKIPAAWLIDRAGCKSMTSGGAALWHRQPLVIVNATGHATGTDVVDLENHIIAAVCARYDIILEPEVEHLPAMHP